MAEPKGAYERLIDLAQAARGDERHWSVVDVADRAETAVALAEAVLGFFDVEEERCPKGCMDCKEHNKNTDNEDREEVS